MELKDYQENAVRELVEKSEKLLNSHHRKNRYIVFQSPTGSGKTIMMAEVLKRLCDIKGFEDELSFIWTAPRKLHKQSKDKLSNYYENTRGMTCSYFEDLQDRKIGFNEILFFNWESVNKKKNVYIRENERGNNLSSVIERTREESRKLILIIDESHHGVDAPATRNAIKEISPDMILRVSATPVKEDCPRVSVDIDDVKREGMIKQGIVLNHGFNKKSGKKILSDKNLSTKEMVLREAIKKRRVIKSLYKKKGLEINPLVLIQLPDKRQGVNDACDEILEVLNREYAITKDNGKLGVWLSEEKENIEEIDKLDSTVEVLVFKQAIALGWDCPRSHVLALLRELSSSSFTIQTLGRIMRVADITQGIYSEELGDLNYAYVFTNLESISLDDYLVKDYTKIYISERKKIYHPLNYLLGIG